MSLGRYDNTLKIAGGKKLASPRSHSLIHRAVKSGAIKYRIHVLKEGERLDIIAGKAYGNGRLWWVIAAASGIGWSPQVPPGTRLLIPTDLNEIEAYV